MRNVIEKAEYWKMIVLLNICIVFVVALVTGVLVTRVPVYAGTEKHLSADNLPQSTDYILVIDDSGSMWYGDDYNMQFVRNAATQTFLRLSKGANNRIAVVYFNMQSDYENSGCSLSSTKNDDEYNKIMDCLKHEQTKEYKRTTKNASTNISAGLNQACDILDRQKNENKPVIILFTDGNNDIKYPITDEEKKLEKSKILFTDGNNDIYYPRTNKEYEQEVSNLESLTIGGSFTDSQKNETEKVDGVNTRIMKSGYELYTVYLENENPNNVTKKGKECRNFLKKLTDTSNGKNKKDTHFYKVNRYETSNDCYELADEFAKVFYASQLNSKHNDILFDKNGDSTIPVPRAAIDQLNIYLTNVPEKSKVVLSRSGSNELLEGERNNNLKNMVYFSIKNPEPGDYILHIPKDSSSDENLVKGGYVYYTDLQSDIDLIKKNIKGWGNIGVKSRIGVRSTFYDADGNPYKTVDEDHFGLTVSVYRKDDDGVLKKECELPMQEEGEYWESSKEYVIEKSGEYHFLAEAELDQNENTLNYTKKVTFIKPDYMYYAKWGMMVLIVIGVLGFLACLYRCWKKAKIKKIRIRIDGETKEINKVCQLMEKQSKEAVSNFELCEEYSKECNDAEESLDEVIDVKHLSELQKKELLIDKFKRVKNKKDEEYLECKNVYKDSRDKFLDFIRRNSEIEEVTEKTSLKEAKKRLNNAVNTRKEANNLYDNSKKLFEKFIDFSSEYKQCVNLANEAYNRTGKILEFRINSKLCVSWQGYIGFMNSKRMDAGFFKLSDVKMGDSCQNMSTLGEILKDIEGVELEIDTYPYISDNGVEGLEMHSFEEFYIKSPSTNDTIVKTKRVIGDEDVVYYVADLVKGEEYLLSIGVPGMGAIKIELY